MIGRHLRSIGWALAMISLAAGGFAIWQSYRETRASAEKDLTFAGSILAREASRTIQVIDLLLRRVELEAAFRSVTTADAFAVSFTDSRTHRLLAAQARELPQSGAIGLFDAKGDMINRASKAGYPPFNVADRDYFVHLRETGRDGLFIQPVPKVRHNGEPGVIFARRISATDGTFLGVAVATVDAPFLTGALGAFSDSHGMAVTLLRRDGMLISRFPAAGQPGDQMPVTSPWYRWVAEGGGTYETPGHFIHVPAMIAVTPLHDYPLVLDMWMPKDRLFAAWHQNSAIIAVVSSLMAISFAALFGAIARHVNAQAALNASLTSTTQALRASERRLADFAALGSDWFWEQGPDLRLTWVSVNIPTANVHEPSRIGNLRWEYQDTTRDPEKWVRHREDLAARRPVDGFTFDQIDPDGSVRHFRISGKPLFGADGTFAGYRGIGQEITAQIAGELALREALDRAERAEALLRDAVESVAEGFAIFDANDRLVMFNDAYRRLFPANAPYLAPGVSYESLLREGLARGEYPDAGDDEDWVTDWTQRHLGSHESAELALRDGRWVLVTNRRMKNGGIAGLRVDITRLKQAQAALRESEARLERAQEIAGIGSWETDLEQGIENWSKELHRIRGIPHGVPVLSCDMPRRVHEDDAPALAAWLNGLKDGQTPPPIEVRVRHPSGQVRLVVMEGRAIVDPDGVIRRLSGTSYDITERRQIEQQLVHAQKMEAIGSLTGGIAHDFNNLLGILVVNLDTLDLVVKDDPRAAPLVADCLNAALSGAGLTQRLLAFARRQRLTPAAVSANQLIEGMSGLLRRSLGETIEVALDLDADLWTVFVDPVQLEAGLLNLSVNARDAMPRGGRLTIVTRNVSIGKDSVRPDPELADGDYAVIEIADTGLGMTAEVKARAFEPFFTTKERGHGTGLGLSMVFGFLRQSNGLITVESAPGQGTAFRLYIPRSNTPAMPVRETRPREPMEGQAETILIVEDNSLLRASLIRQVRALNYRVFEARDAGSALRVLETQAVDLVLSDVVMPGGMDGVALAHTITQRWPAVRIILTSGFTATRDAGDAPTLPPFAAFLHKPFRAGELAAAIRARLATRPRRSGASWSVADEIPMLVAE